MGKSQWGDVRLMTSAAHLYYEEHRTQEEIARELGVSRPIISRLLQRALDEGIVQITIHDPFETSPELANELCQLTGLPAAIVVGGGFLSNQQMNQRRLGFAASQFLAENLKPNDIIGVGWGRTLASVVQTLTPGSLPGITAVPLVGGLGSISPNFQVHEITRQVAEAFSGAWQPLYFPAIISDQDARDTLVNTQDFKEIVQVWDRITVALVGLGNVSFDAEMQVLFANYLDAPTRRRLLARGAVGDICMRFFDIQGRPIMDGLHGVVGIDLDCLARVPNTIAIAGGKHKAAAILGAIRGKYIHTLITDREAVEVILEQIRRGR
ncbi:MAG: sugar-binding transcriptional regulator [Anaerolineaceae bacterium]|nr:sugar-binding transcriptional regulator [Anaerolineaceae bacterium]